MNLHTMNRSARWTLIVAAVLLAGLIQAADAATGLAVITTQPCEGLLVSACPNGGGKYQTPTADSLVRDCGTVAPYDCWSATARYVKFAALEVGHAYETCATDIPDPSTIPTNWTAASDPCKSWVKKTKAGAANTTGAFKLSWDAPSVNTDGTALTDLAGFWIYSAAQGQTLGKLLQITSPAARNTTLSGYGAGNYDFGVSAYNTANKEGAMLTGTGTVDASGKTPGAVISLKVERVQATTP